MAMTENVYVWPIWIPLSVIKVIYHKIGEFNESHLLVKINYNYETLTI